MTRNARSGVALLCAAVVVAGCMRQDAMSLSTHGDPGRGREALRTYGCTSCHTIAGVTGARSLVGPPLTGIASRTYIAGVLLNSPDNMVRWIQDPPAVDSQTAMPNLHVSEADARDIASYLYTR
jgi:cytochrome c2